MIEIKVKLIVCWDVEANTNTCNLNDMAVLSGLAALAVLVIV